MLRADVALGAGGGLERHGAAGALVEHLAMSRLNVGLDGVEPPEHHLAAGASGHHDDRGHEITGLRGVGASTGH